MNSTLRPIVRFVALTLLTALSAAGRCWAQGPELLAVKVSSPAIVRPAGANVHFAHLSFEYAAGKSPISHALIATVTDKKFPQVHVAGGAVGIVGPKGIGRYQVAFNASSPLGAYEYRVQLVDQLGNKSDELSATVTLVQDGVAPITVTAATPASGKVGALISLAGTGFIAGKPGPNSVFIGGIQAPVTQALAGSMTFRVPQGAASGPVTVVNSAGIAYSPAKFTVLADVKLTRPGGGALTTLTSASLSPRITGIEVGTVEWRVNGIAGGTEVLGTIDSAGTYHAPAAPVPAGVVITAVDKSTALVLAQTRIAPHAPTPLRGKGLIKVATGGRALEPNGLLAIEVDPAKLSGEAAISTIKSEFVKPGTVIQNIPETAIPLAKFDIRTTSEPKLYSPAKFRAMLPRQMTPGALITAYLTDKLGNSLGTKPFKVASDGQSVEGLIPSLDTSVCLTTVDGIPTLTDGPMPLVTSIRAPGAIEEGSTIPVLIQGTNFRSGNSHVWAHCTTDPTVDAQLTVGPTLVSADGTQLGFTLHVGTLPQLRAGQTIPVSFTVSTITAKGKPASTVEAGPVTVQGLDELSLVKPGGPIYTVDGQHVDRVISDNARYSEIYIARGMTLGIGSLVGVVSGATEAGGSIDLTSIDAFEAAYGKLPWLTADLRSKYPNLRIFQPSNKLITLECTGPVNIQGAVIFSGMRGGENMQMTDPAIQGKARIGGLASGVLSGGWGGDGRVSQGEITVDGRPAGNSVPDRGRGRLGGGDIDRGQAVGGEGSRFDPVSFSFDNYFKTPVTIISHVFSAATPEMAAAGLAEDLFKLAISSALAPTNVPGPIPSTSGRGGSGGSLAPEQSPIMPDNAAIPLRPSGGGAGGGGGGSSFSKSTLFSLNVQTDPRKGGGGGGGGGAAGALKITAGGPLAIADQAQLLGIGGRGGNGEPHGALAGPGGGGGGGAGGVLKIQAPQVYNSGWIDLSGGDIGGSLLIDTNHGVPIPTQGSGRIHVLDGASSGAFLYYGSDQAGSIFSDHALLAWPDGRACAIGLQVPSNGTGSIRAIGHGYSPIGVLTAQISHERPLERYILIISSDKRLIVATAPDPASGAPAIVPLGGDSGSGGVIADLNTIPDLLGFALTAVCQSPVAPYNIYVGGFKDTDTPGIAQAQVFELDSGGGFRRTVWSGRTLARNDMAGNIRSLDVRSDGVLVMLMCPETDQPGGVYSLNPAGGTPTRVWQDAANLASVAIMRPAHVDPSVPTHSPGRAAQPDLFFAVQRGTAIALDTDGGVGIPPLPGQPRVQRRDMSGIVLPMAAFGSDSISSPGAPGMCRIDGALPGSLSPRIDYAGQPLPDMIFHNAKTTYGAPVVSSFTGALSGLYTEIEGLVFGGTGTIHVFGQGADPTRQVVINCNNVGTRVSPDGLGQVTGTVTLTPGFNTIWMTTDDSGPAPELLKKVVLYIP